MDNKYITEREGLSQRMRNGEVCTIIKYHNANNIDIQFEDGTIIKNTTYKYFMAGLINKKTRKQRRPNYNILQKSRVGLVNTMNSGYKAEIIRYTTYRNIDVKFEDGTILYHRRYDEFLNGTIRNPHRNEIDKSRLGMTCIMNCGKTATIIRYGNSLDIDVQFEDGTIVKGKTFENFIKGHIKHPDIHFSKDLSKTMVANPNKHKKRIGEQNLQNCGQIATITEYYNSENISVVFPDGTVVTNRKYDDFKRGRIKHPNTKHHRFNDRTGEERVMNSGEKATIIAYRGINDIDVQFEDSTVKYNQHYNNFKRGQILKNSRPSLEQCRKERVGEKRMMNCGKEATVTEYYNYDNITVMFEDGTIVKKRKYKEFSNGKIRCPHNKKDPD